MMLLVWLRNECLMPTQEALAFIKAAWEREGAQTSRQEGVREDTWQLTGTMKRSCWSLLLSGAWSCF